MTDYLNIWVAGAILCSVPILTEKQKSAADKVSQGARDGQIFMAVEDIPRITISV